MPIEMDTCAASGTAREQCKCLYDRAFVVMLAKSFHRRDNSVSLRALTVYGIKLKE